MAGARNLTVQFVLTMRTTHWCPERGLRSAAFADLPQQKQTPYHWQRKALDYRKPL